jgi:hypothetical protein
MAGVVSTDQRRQSGLKLPGNFTTRAAGFQGFGMRDTTAYRFRDCTPQQSMWGEAILTVGYVRAPNE